MGLTARIRTRDGWAVSHAVVTLTDGTGSQVLRAEADAEGAVRDATELAPGAYTVVVTAVGYAPARGDEGAGQDRGHGAAAARPVDRGPGAQQRGRRRPAPGHLQRARPVHRLHSLGGDRPRRSIRLRRDW